MRPQPLICVRDVEASSHWYQRLLGCRSDHGGPHYERLVSQGQLVLQLHRWDVEHHHGRIGDPDVKPGNGLLLWFEVDDFDAAVGRAAELHAEIVLPRHRNPPDGAGGPNHWEIWLRDPDGYTVVLASPDGTADGNWKPNHGHDENSSASRLTNSGTGTDTTCDGIRYSDDRELALESVLALYRANQWSSAQKPESLHRALLASHSLFTAWDGDRLVGLGNALSDGSLVVYYSHLLVLPEYRGRGIGRKLMRRLMARYKGFHQHVLIADGRAVDFYRKCGFERAGKTEPMWIYSGDDH